MQTAGWQDGRVACDGSSQQASPRPLVEPRLLPSQLTAAGRGGRVGEGQPARARGCAGASRTEPFVPEDTGGALGLTRWHCGSGGGVCGDQPGGSPVLPAVRPAPPFLLSDHEVRDSGHNLLAPNTQPLSLTPPRASTGTVDPTRSLLAPADTLHCEPGKGSVYHLFCHPPPPTFLLNFQKMKTERLHNFHHKTII